MHTYKMLPLRLSLDREKFNITETFKDTFLCINIILTATLYSA